MNHSILILGLGFLLLTALMLWVVIAGRGGWKLKLPFVIIVPFFMFLVWGAIASFSGWPVKGQLPKAALLVSYEVVEPDPLTHTKGKIFLWMVPPKTHHSLLKYSPQNGEPRAYELPYTKQLHEQLQKAGTALANGAAVELKLTKTKKSPHGTIGNYKHPIYMAVIFPPQLPPKSLP